MTIEVKLILLSAILVTLIATNAGAQDLTNAKFAIKATICKLAVES